MEKRRLPQQMAGDPIVTKKLSETFPPRRDQRTRFGPWTKATDLELWADYLDARARLPQLVRRLVHATVNSLEKIEFPVGEGIQRPGWDGIVATTNGNAFVPSGLSGWEIGVDRDPRKKAEDDFQKRSKNPLGLNPSETCFVFVTSRKWTNKMDWCDEKKKLNIWKDVRVYDSANLEEWLEIAPTVDAWIARLLGHRPDGVSDIEEHWANLSSLTEPSLKPEVFLTSREEEIKSVEEWLKKSPSSLAFEAPSPNEVIDFMAAYMASREESERDKLESRMVIVEGKEAWRVLCTAANSLLLIASPHLSIDAETVAEAVRQRHRVLLCFPRFVGNPTDKHEFSRPHRHDLEKALVLSSISEEKASRLAQEAGGSLTILKRRLSRFPSTRQPEWSQPSYAPDLAPMLLAGGWDDAISGDRDVVAKLADRSYEEVLSTATRWLTSEDPPLIRFLTHRSLVSHEDAWVLLAPSLTRQHLDLFEKVAIEVLGENDPLYDLPPNERWRAGLSDKQLKYSYQLRSGVAETLALLGTKSDSKLIQDAIEPARRAEHVVRRLLENNVAWKQWASLSSYLPALAEASPEAFLDAVESDLRSKKPQLPQLFVDAAAGDPLFSSCTHAGLLWAFETLAWEPSLLSRVSLTLAHLAQIVPEGRWAKHPITTLQEIFLSWLPKTTASVEQRIKILKTLTQKVPDIAWHLLLDLLPTGHGISIPTSRPRWRDWVLNWSHRVTNAEHWRQVDECADLLIDLVDTDVERCVQLIERFENFPLPAQDRLIEILKAFDLNIFDTPAQKRIADELREKINKHRSFPEARWVLSAEKLNKLEALKERFQPQDLVARHSWLFTIHPELAGDYNPSWEQREVKLFQLRYEVLSEIFASEGLQGVFVLVEKAEDSNVVGRILGKGPLLETDASILPLLLISENQKIADFALGYGQGRFKDAGWRWIEQIDFTQWTPEQVGRFLAFVPDFGRRTWELVEQLGAEATKEYWSRTHGLYSNATTKDVESAAAMLLKYNRPLKAVEVLSAALYKKYDVDSSLLMTTLEAELNQQEKTVEAQGNIRYKIQQLFRKLHSDPNVDIERLARLEWNYLGLLDGTEASPKTLHQLLQTQPKFFADLLSVIYRSDKEPEESIEEPTEAQKARAQNAYHLLREWKSVPWKREDNTVDEQEILAWVTEARRLCQENGRLVMCDGRIGEVIAYAPAEADRTWPCVAVRDVIDEVDSVDMARGFEIGIFNKHRVHGKSSIEGSKQERELAREYTSYAEACAIEWPTTAAVLRRVARQYEEDARREDEKAQERALR